MSKAQNSRRTRRALKGGRVRVYSGKVQTSFTLPSNPESMRKWRRNNGCPRMDKDAYFTFMIAHKVASKYNGCVAYKCRCGYYHVGNKRTELDKLVV